MKTTQMISEKWVSIDDDLDIKTESGTESETEAYYRAVLISLLEDPQVDHYHNQHQVYDSQRLLSLIKSLEAEINDVNAAAAATQSHPRNQSSPVELMMGHLQSPHHDQDAALGIDYVGQQAQFLCPPTTAGFATNWNGYDDDGDHQLGMMGVGSMDHGGIGMAEVAGYGGGIWELSQQNWNDYYV